MKTHKKQLNTKKSKQGFTIVEALVAIFILVVSVTGLLGVVSQSIFNSSYIKNKAVAISLAQEGVELVRNIQDTALLNNEQSTAFPVFLGNTFGSCIFGTGLCTIDPTSLTINSCSDDGCPPLQISDTGYFNYSFGDDSNSHNGRFTRNIKILPTGSTSGKAEVSVEWEQGSTIRSVEYEIEIFPWIAP